MRRLQERIRRNSYKPPALNPWGIRLLAVSLICIPSVKGQNSMPDCVDCQHLDIAKAPQYRVARRLTTTKAGLIVYISIDKKKFTPNDLKSLACRLNRDFEREPDLLVLIFDNRRSAKRYVPRWTQEKPAGWQGDEKAQRATYLRVLNESKNSIAWYMDPLNKTGEISLSLCAGGWRSP